VHARQRVQDARVRRPPDRRARRAVDRDLIDAGPWLITQGSVTGRETLPSHWQPFLVRGAGYRHWSTSTNSCVVRLV
jgi:hypothetical protein